MAKKSDPTKRAESAGDWKGELLSRLRALITEAAPAMTEERKWVKPSNPAGVPTFSHNGLVCTCETYKRVVKMTFARWPRWRTRRVVQLQPRGKHPGRAIDFREADEVDEEALKDLIRAAVA